MRKLGSLMSELKAAGLALVAALAWILVFLFPGCSEPPKVERSTEPKTTYVSPDSRFEMEIVPLGHYKQLFVVRDKQRKREYLVGSFGNGSVVLNAGGSPLEAEDPNQK